MVWLRRLSEQDTWAAGGRNGLSALSRGQAELREAHAALHHLGGDDVCQNGTAELCPYPETFKVIAQIKNSAQAAEIFQTFFSYRRVHLPKEKNKNKRKS